ncbi:ankyrin repeat domain-containing protein [Hydrogenophaga sp.]
MNAVDRDELTPAHHVALWGHAGAIAALGAAGANLNAPDRDGRTPAHIAVARGHVAAIAALGEAGANLNATGLDGWTPTHLAVQSAQVGAIDALGHAGADLNAPGFDGSTPSHVAACMGHSDIIAALHAGRANLNAMDRDGLTPAHLAAHENRAGVIAALHAAGADLSAAKNALNPEGWTPAHMAARRGHSGALNALHDAGAKLDEAGGFRNETPADRAASHGHHAVAETLIFYREGALMEKVHHALNQSTDQAHKNLVIDLRCPVLLEPYTTRGETRPVKLPDGVDARTGRVTTPGSVLSAAAAFRCMQPGVAGDHGRPPPTDPTTRRVFTAEEAQAFLNSPGFVQGDPARMALVAAVGEACRQTDRSAQALAAAAAEAAQTAAAAAVSAPRDFRAILAAQGPGAAAGTGGGAAAGPRPDRGGPSP